MLVCRVKFTSSELNSLFIYNDGHSLGYSSQSWFENMSMSWGGGGGATSCRPYDEHRT